MIHTVKVILEFACVWWPIYWYLGYKERKKAEKILKDAKVFYQSSKHLRLPRGSD